MLLLYFAAIAIFLLSTYSLAHARIHIAILIAYLCLAILFFAITIFFGVSYTFTGTGITSAVWYHLETGLTGAGMGTFQSEYIIIGLITFACFALLYQASIATNLPHTKKRFAVASILLLTIAYTIHPSTHSIYSYVHARSSVQPVTPIAIVAQNTDAPPDPDAFTTYYSEPHITPTSTPKNLILLYVEGLEDTYSDNQFFDNLTPELDRIAAQADVFTNIREIEGSSFTIAGMVASQCGIPLVSAGHGNGLSGIDTFLPGARCLGDLLAEQGYTLTYMGGADLTFAGKGTFYAQHGYNTVLGKHELTPTLKDPTYMNGWGIYDDTMLSLVYDEFVSLSEKQTPFVLSTITLDTHPPSGFPSASCTDIIRDNDDTALLSTVRCADTLIASFIDQIAASPYASNTVIAVVSDHYMMRPYTRIPREQRKNRFMVIDFETKNDKGNVYSTPGSHLDVATTLLPYLGFNGDIGLGRDLRTTERSEDEAEKVFYAASRWRGELLSFWQYPTITNDLIIDPSASDIHIGSRTFAYPALIGYSEDLSTGVAFRFNMEEHTLVSQSRALRPGQGFVMVDNCSIIANFYEQAPGVAPFTIPTDTDYCVVYGNNATQQIRALSKKDVTTFTPAELISFISYTASNE